MRPDGIQNGGQREKAKGEMRPGGSCQLCMGSHPENLYQQEGEQGCVQDCAHRRHERRGLKKHLNILRGKNTTDATKRRDQVGGSKD